MIGRHMKNHEKSWKNFGKKCLQSTYLCGILVNGLSLDEGKVFVLVKGYRMIQRIFAVSEDNMLTM